MANTNPWIKTLALAAVAGGMVALVAATRPTDKPYAGGSNDQGSPLAPTLTDPQKVASLEVIGWDAQDARPRAFKVAIEGGKWVVPSAFNYPVDATQNMAAAASSFIGALKERIVTDQASEHAHLGVVAPDDISSSATTGRGTRVTMRDTSGKTVADVIIGGPVPDQSAAPGAPPAKRYIREVGKNRVYTTTLNQAYSTKFADWVQTDLLKLTADQVKAVGIDRYRIDEQKGTLTDIKSLTLTRPAQAAPANPDQPPPSQPWALNGSEGPAPAGGTVNQARVDDMLSALSTLKIVGVRPKPPNLAALMGGDKNEGKIAPSDQASLQRHGFFIAGSGSLVANEGSMTVQCADGVLYTLWIGELATDDATKDQAQGANASAADGKAKPADGRYMMVTVSFDESLVGNAPVKPAELVQLEAESAAATAEKPMSDDSKARLANLGLAYKAQSDGHAKRIAAGRERQTALAKRFAAWYYVVDAASLAHLRPTRQELLSAQAPSPQTQPPAVIPTMQGQ